MKLRGFLADVKIVSNATDANSRDLCVSFIIGRLEGRALDSIPDDVESIDEIVKRLKSKIKSEPSEVVESKILNLRVRKSDFNKFSEVAEKLCESFRRSLVVEGIPDSVAEKWTIKRAVKLCRQTARDDAVKNLVGAAKYETPAEVFSTFLTELENSKEEKKAKDAAMLRSQQGNNPRFNNNRNNSGNARSHNNRNFGRNNNNNNSSGRNFDGRNNRHSGGNANYGNNRNNNNSSGNFRGKNSRRNGNEQIIRLVSGAPSTQAAIAAREEQFFRLEN